MIVGTLHARLLVRESRTLKDKRQVVRAILDRLRHQFNVVGRRGRTPRRREGDRARRRGRRAGAGPVRGVLQTIAEALREHPVAEYLGGEHRPSAAEVV